MQNLLEVKNMSISFDTYAGEVQAVRDVTFNVGSGEIVAVVGESGSGKSVLTQSLVKLLPNPPARIKSGNVIFNGKDISNYSFKELQSIKGKEIAYIFQDPMTSLNPVAKIGNQVIEGIVSHKIMSKNEAKKYVIELLKNSGIPSPEKRINQYPHELSGGMRQRVMIAIAIAMNPKLLVADEPTTALDVTTQSQILGTLKELNKKMNMSMILITHDMGIVAGMADRVIIMYGGKIVESGNVLEIFENSRHPYTKCLLGAVPKLNIDQSKDLEYIVGSPPDMLNPESGCPFSPRCAYCMNICKKSLPKITQITETHFTHCHLMSKEAKEHFNDFIKKYPDSIGGESYYEQYI